MPSAPGEPIIYSIGHSDHDLPDLIALLRRHDVSTVVDVRSQPYSRWVPQANRETLARALEEAGLAYIFMGDVLGGRPTDPALYASDGALADPSAVRPTYDLIAASPAFQEGLGRLLELARANTVAMMCSEGDHRHCHRALLITPQLLERDARVIHIRPDGQTIEARPAPKQLTLF
jgi:uncharacterized protein (DUF488 family)